MKELNVVALGTSTLDKFSAVQEIQRWTDKMQGRENRRKTQLISSVLRCVCSFRLRIPTEWMPSVPQHLVIATIYGPVHKQVHVHVSTHNTHTHATDDTTILCSTNEWMLMPFALMCIYSSERSHCMAHETFLSHWSLLSNRNHPSTATYTLIVQTAHCTFTCMRAKQKQKKTEKTEIDAVALLSM